MSLCSTQYWQACLGKVLSFTADFSIKCLHTLWHFSIVVAVEVCIG